ncbi:MAG: hypothetical protein FJ104_07770 [Deltaproteobacteria bacterium]|nr:hypothetical protein [Deltaproteobacteria bacterium]
MKPWVEIDRGPVPGGGELVLCQRGSDFVIRVDGLELMGSRSHGSEERLAAVGCEGLRGRPGARVLIGGLGMGFTLRAALRALADDATVEVAELVPSVIRWNRGPLAPLAGAPLSDPRVHVIEGDVTHPLARAEAAYDVILLDVDNGPVAMTRPQNRHLYAPKGIARARDALRPGGLLAVWSTSDSPEFTRRLTEAGLSVRVERPPARLGGGRRHVLWFARRAAAPSAQIE